MRPLERLVRRKALSDPVSWSPNALTSWSVSGDRETIAENFEGYVRRAYKANGVVFACILARLMVFSEARFLYQSMAAGRPGELAWDDSLRLLDTPWPNGTTGELLARMEQDASLAGNFYATTAGDGERIRRLRPDWVTTVTGSPTDDPFDIEAEILGYIYAPRNGVHRLDRPILLTPDRVVHYSPIPDPEAQWRGMSWLTPVLREVQADTAATRHKLKFFENGTSSNFVVSYDATVGRQQFLDYVDAFREAHEGVDNAYKTIHLGGGADVTTVGANLRQLDFKATQGAGETRIAAAAGVGAVMANLSEGMQGSALNAGNYGAARRRFADGTLRPLWRTAAASLSKLTTPPPSSRLWYDETGIAFLREDARDAADIELIKATTIAGLVKEGFTPESAKAAILASDLGLLDHTGLVSVQLQPPGGASLGDAPPATPSDLVAMVQKVYLGVGSVLTVDEARQILNRAGAGLTGPPPIPS